jgi:hypothetical protein
MKNYLKEKIKKKIQENKILIISDRSATMSEMYSLLPVLGRTTPDLRFST